MRNQNNLPPLLAALIVAVTFIASLQQAQAEAIRRARKLARKRMQREGLLPMKPKPTTGPGALAWAPRRPGFGSFALPAPPERHAPRQSAGPPGTRACCFGRCNRYPCASP